MCAAQERAVSPVRAAEWINLVERFSRGSRAIPSRHNIRQQLRIVHTLPARAGQLLRGLARVLVPAAVEPETRAIAVSHPSELRNRIRHGPELPFRHFAIGYIVNDHLDAAGSHRPAIDRKVT